MLIAWVSFNIISKNWWRFLHCVKSVGIRSFSGPYFPAFGLNTEKYSVYLPIQSECGKIQTKKTPNTDTFSAILITWWYHENGHELLSFNYIMKWALLFAHLRIVKISSRSMLAARPSLPVPYWSTVWLQVLPDFIEKKKFNTDVEWLHQGWRIWIQHFPET